MLDLRAISLTTARELIERKCYHVSPPWMDLAEWFVCTLDADEFQRPLMFNGGRPASGWQEVSGGSYEIAQVAIGLRDYKGHKADLVRTKRNVLFYEERMERGEFPEALCLLRVSSNGRITLFETNQRAVALYLFYFVDKKAPYTPIEGILGETKAKLLFQSQ